MNEADMKKLAEELMLWRGSPRLVAEETVLAILARYVPVSEESGRDEEWAFKVWAARRGIERSGTAWPWAWEAWHARATPKGSE